MSAGRRPVAYAREVGKGAVRREMRRERVREAYAEPSINGCVSRAAVLIRPTAPVAGETKNINAHGASAKNVCEPLYITHSSYL